MMCVLFVFTCLPTTWLGFMWLVSGKPQSQTCKPFLYASLSGIGWLNVCYAVKNEYQLLAAKKTLN